MIAPRRIDPVGDRFAKPGVASARTRPLLSSPLGLLALFLTLGLVAGPRGAASAQTPTPEPEVARPEARQSDELDFLDQDSASEEAAESEFRGTQRGDLALIEGLLEAGEDSVDTGFVYDPGGRRDPFRSLLRATDVVEKRAGPRPEGIPGLLIEELTLSGVWMLPDGPVAQVQSAEDPISYLLRPGTRVFDGEVISVTFSREEGGVVVFRQVVRDPTSPKPFREVVRRIEP